jgi:hypothetical protein
VCGRAFPPRLPSYILSHFIDYLSLTTYAAEDYSFKHGLLVYYHQINMNYYKVRYGGCNHSSILAESQLHKEVKEQRLNPDTGTKEDYYFCPACMNGEPGCSSIHGTDDRSVLRPIADAKKLSPIDIFKMGIVQRAPH